LETIVNFALEHKALAERLFGVQRALELAQLVTMQSCVKEALLLAETTGVHAMHDATEGGLTAALNEIAEASGLGFQIEYEKIPVPTETHALQNCFRLSEEQLLSMSSTGTILAAIAPEAKDNVQKTLRQHGVEASFLGVFTKSRARIIVKKGKMSRFPRVAEDPYGRILFGKV
jgi:hydrogenase maturation factor